MARQSPSSAAEQNANERGLESNYHPADGKQEIILDDATRAYIQTAAQMLAEIIRDWIERQNPVMPEEQSPE